MTKLIKFHVGLELEEYHWMSQMNYLTFSDTTFTKLTKVLENFTAFSLM